MKKTISLYLFLLLGTFLSACQLSSTAPIQPTSVEQFPTNTPIPTPTHSNPEKQQDITNPTAGSEGIGDSLFPLMGNGGYDVEHYLLDLDVDVENNTIHGTATLTIKATQNLSQFNLELRGMEIEEILVDGFEAVFKRNGGELTIILPEPIASEQGFSTAITYNGEPIDPNTYEIDGWYPYDGGIFVAGEPTGSSHWYPVNEHPLDKAGYTFLITVPKPFAAAANGTLVEVFESGEYRSFHFDSPEPIASYLVTVGIADFDIERSTTESGVTIRNYFEKSLPSYIRNDFDAQGEMLDYFSSVFGPYPFEEYGALVHDVELGFAIETQTLSVFGSSFTTEDAVAHELAHQWYGNSVTLSSWEDLWLNEGFATYASVLWKEHSSGEQAAEDTLRQYYVSIANAINGNANYVPVGKPQPNNLFTRNVYYRGALTLHALRTEVGDDDFFNILQTYAERYAYSNASTPDFIALAEEISGQELDSLFQDWLYEIEIPEFPE